MPVLSASFNRNQGSEELPLSPPDDSGTEQGETEVPNKMSSGTVVASSIGLLATSALLAGAI